MKSYVLCASVILALTLSLFTGSLQAANDITDKTTGISFPEHITFIFKDKEYQLQATGVATRKKFVIKVYSIAHYLQDGAKTGEDKIPEILQDTLAKQLTIKWVRDVPANKIQEAYQEGLKNSLGSQYGAMQDDSNKFLSFFSQDAKKGDEQILRWIPGGNIEVVINDNSMGTITNVDFAKGLWNIWFGPNSVVDKDNLISMMN
jgi:hypothetical protein